MHSVGKVCKYGRICRSDKVSIYVRMSIYSIWLYIAKYICFTDAVGGPGPSVWFMVGENWSSVWFMAKHVSGTKGAGKTH